MDVSRQEKEIDMINKLDTWQSTTPAQFVEEEECGILPPVHVDFYRTTFTGELRARCTECEFVSAYWECACDLYHVCEEN